MIYLKNISVTFNPKSPLQLHVLRNINLSIQEHSFLTIIGGNGSGKSTLLNTIAGDILPSHGSILIDQKDFSKKHLTQRAHLISRVFQDPLAGSCPDLTIEENMALAFQRGLPLSLSPALSKPKSSYFRQLLKELSMNLDHRLHDPISSLSGGQRQAISLLMATLQKPKVLLLDEHTAALDPKTAKKIMDLTHFLVREKNRITTLMVTHSMHHALEYGDRTILLKDGSISQDWSGPARSSLSPHDLFNYFD